MTCKSFEMYRSYYNRGDAQATAKIRNAARLMVAIAFGQPILVIGEDDQNVEVPLTETVATGGLLPRFQNRTKVCELDNVFLIPKALREWRDHPNYLDYSLRNAIEQFNQVHIQCFLRAFNQFFKRAENSRMDIEVHHGEMVVTDLPGLQAAAREWLDAFRESEFYDEHEASMNLQRDITTYIGFVENGVLDEHERTHTLKSAHLYFMRLFRWLPLAEKDDAVEFFDQTKEENLEFVDEMVSDWPQVWPCTLSEDPDDLFDRQFPIVTTSKTIGAFGNDANGSYSVYLPRHVIASYLFTC